MRELFRSDITRDKEVQVDRDKNIIRGFAVVTKGVTKDARGEFDDASLDTVMQFGNEMKMGIKSRFGHPNMSSTALGTFLGRVKNFRRDGDIVRADLQIDKTAFETPDGDLGGYVMNLAESNPDMFGASMVIYWDGEEREELDQDGNTLPPFIRVTKLMSVDVVDDPAANNGLFGMPFFSDSVKPSAEMTAFLDRFLATPDAVDRAIGFLNKYNTNKTHKVEKEKSMDALTVEQLKSEHKDVFEAVKKEGFDFGVESERTRNVAILKEAQAFEGMQELAFSAIESGLTTEKAVINFQQKRLDDLESASAPKVGGDVEEEPKKKLSHLDRAKQYKEEHSCSMTEALQATAEKRKEA